MTMKEKRQDPVGYLGGVGVLEDGVLEDGPVQRRPLETGSAQISAREVGLLEVGLHLVAWGRDGVYV